MKPEIAQLSYGIEQANSYLLISDNRTIVVDVPSQYVLDELLQRELIPDYVILTHEHADHLWGLNSLRETFLEVKVIAQEQCSEAIVSPLKNQAVQYHIYAALRFGMNYINPEAENKKYHCKPADIVFHKEYEFQWCGYRFKMLHTPGHSPGSSLLFMDDLVFSGDTMLNENTFLRFDGGDEENFSRITFPILCAMDSDTKIFPGHGRPFMKREWSKEV